MLTPRRRTRFTFAALVLIAMAAVLLAGAGIAESGTRTIGVVADTYASSARPTATHGTSSTMRVDGAPRIAYVRFTVANVSGSVTKAVLRFYATRGTSTGFEVQVVPSNNWNEATLTWANRPALAGTVVGRSGPFGAKRWVSVDVTSLVRSSGTYSFALTSSSPVSDYMALATKERGSSRAPQLVLEETESSVDVQSPTTPGGLTPIDVTGTSVTLSWLPSTDNSGAVTYGLYQDGASITSTSATSHTFTGLSCGRSYTFGVDARDAAGNLSGKAQLTVPTASCGDRQAPSAPTGLVQTDATAAGVSVRWTASTDDVGVTGYAVKIDGRSVPNTTSTLYSFSGLSCGSAYTVGVAAFDAAGNTSSEARLGASTAACAVPDSTSRSYYLDSTGGSDTNAGTSPATAWRTLAKAGAVTLGAGDRLLLRRGGAWTGSLKLPYVGTASAPVLVDAYGDGPLPRLTGASSCVVISGQYIVVRQIHADDCSWAGVEIAGSKNRLEKALVTHNVTGVYVKSGALDNAIVGNEIRDNNKMSVLTTSGDDDSGAFGVLVHGDRTEVAENRISGSDAFSYDYGRDGAAIEIYGGRQTNVHHNLAIDNDAFTELGNSRSTDTTYAYNVVRSSLASSIFLVTRGASSGFGPVLRTRVYNNTAVLTGASSQGFVCHAGCNADILSMRNNVIQAVWKAGYADAAFDEDYNVFFGGIVQFQMGANSRVADPRFVDVAAGDLHLRSTSPAVDTGSGVVSVTDFDGFSVPADGDGDGLPELDRGSYEYRAAAAPTLPSGPVPDGTPPTQPANLSVTTSTQTSLTISWSASTDNVGVAGYAIYRNGSLVTTTNSTSNTLSALSCGSSYTIAVDAYDAAGNRSAKASIVAATAPCPDTTAPTTPASVAVSAATPTSITLMWGASFDNVGVAGYGLYRNGTLIGTSALPTAVFVGLSCGTSYTLGVDAYDAANNRSQRSSIVTSTGACGDAQAPTVSLTSPAAGASLSGTVALAASASDNVGVTQVKWYVDGAEVAVDGDGAPWQQSWNSASVSDGSHQLLAKARDAAGNWGTSATISFTAANSAAPPPPPPPPPPPSEGDPVIAAAGDVACVPGSSPSASTCREKYTADVITQMNPAAVLMLGDAQYETGTLSNFMNSYDKTWGVFKDKTWATAGSSHDLYGGGDFYTYFGSRAGPAPYRWYSVNIGAWHIVSLNANCSNANVGGCGVGSSQYNWLRDDLAASTAQCTLAFWHQPRWSSGPRHGSDPVTDPLVRLLYDDGAELILSGHDHDYERFAPQSPDGNRDDARGLVQFVVGTGGKWLEDGFGTVRPNSLARQNDTFGVLKLTLHASSYDWSFVPEAGRTYSDSGSASCH